MGGIKENLDNKMLEAGEIVDSAINMGLEVICGKEEGIRILANKLVDGTV